MSVCMCILYFAAIQRNKDAYMYVYHILVLLRISKSCKRTDSDGFFKKSADPDADSDSGLRRPPPAAP